MVATYVREENIRRFEHMLTTEQDEARLAMIRALLAAERAIAPPPEKPADNNKA